MVSYHQAVEPEICTYSLDVIFAATNRHRGYAHGIGLLAGAASRRFAVTLADFNQGGQRCRNGKAEAGLP